MNKTRRVDKIPRFITGFNNQWGELRTILKKHWGILTSDPKLATILPREPVLTIRRAPNLRDRLTAILSPNTPGLDMVPNYKGRIPVEDVTSVHS